MSEDNAATQTPPEPATAPEGSPPTGDTPAQGNTATPASGGNTKPDYDPKSFGAGLTKGKAEAAKKLAEYEQRLSKYEDADKTAEQLKTERDQLHAELAKYREREAERLAAVKTEAGKALAEWPEEAQALVDLESATDPDVLRNQVAHIGKLVAKASAAPKPVPGGKAAPANTPSIDMAALDAAKKSGDITRYRQELMKLHSAHGVDQVNAARAARAGK